MGYLKAVLKIEWQYSISLQEQQMTRKKNSLLTVMHVTKRSTQFREHQGNILQRKKKFVDISSFKISVFLRGSPDFTQKLTTTD